MVEAAFTLPPPGQPEGRGQTCSRVLRCSDGSIALLLRGRVTTCGTPHHLKWKVTGAPTAQRTPLRDAVTAACYTPCRSGKEDDHAQTCGDSRTVSSRHSSVCGRPRPRSRDPHHPQRALPAHVHASHPPPHESS